MTRMQKTVRNLAVTVLFFLLWVWCSAWYLDPAACVSDSLDQLYFSPHELLMSTQPVPNERIYLAVQPDGTYAIHRAKKHLFFFWEDSGGSTGMTVHPEEALYIAQGGNADTSYTVLYRNDPSIVRVEAEVEGTLYETDTWVQDYALLSWADDWKDAWFRAYDAAGQLVYEGS